MAFDVCVHFGTQRDISLVSFTCIAENINQKILHVAGTRLANGLQLMVRGIEFRVMTMIGIKRSRCGCENDCRCRAA